MTYIGTTDFDLQVSRGLVQGVSKFSKYGYNTDLDTADGFRVIWNAQTAWRPMGAADTLNFSSTSANDAAGGTGARELTIIGTDENGDEQTEVIATNGLSTVTTLNQWLSVNAAFVSDAGALEWNDGDITISETTLGQAQGFLTAETSTTHQLFFTVPNGKTAFIENVLLRVAKVIGGGSPIVELKFFKHEGGVTFEIQRAIIDAAFDIQINQRLVNPEPISQGGYWWIEADTDTNNTFIRGSVEQKIIDN